MFAPANVRISVSGELVGQLANRGRVRTTIGAPWLWRRRRQLNARRLGPIVP